MTKKKLTRVIKMFLIQVSQKRPRASSREEVLIKIFRATNLMHQISQLLMPVHTFGERVLSNFGNVSQAYLAVRFQRFEDSKINHFDGSKNSTIHVSHKTN